MIILHFNVAIRCVEMLRSFTVVIVLNTLHVLFSTCVPCTEYDFFRRILELHDLG